MQFRQAVFTVMSLSRHIGGSQKGFTCQNHLPLAFWDSMWDGEVIFILKLGAKKGQQTWNEMFYRRNRIPKRYSTPDCGLDICQIQSDCNIKQSFISKPNNHKFTESVRGLRIKKIKILIQFPTPCKFQKDKFLKRPKWN